MSELSFAQTYILASKVRSKLTKEASNPKSSLRNLVVQANMLDNLMDYISEETEKRSKVAHVKFDLADRTSSPSTSTSTGSTSTTNYKTSITEYEIDSDSDSDSDDDDADYYYDDEEEEDDDDEEESDSDDYYYYSDSDEVEDMEEEHDLSELTKLTAPMVASPKPSTYKQLPYINLSLNSIEEVDEDDLVEEDELSQDSEEDTNEPASPTDIPELYHCESMSEEEEEEDQGLYLVSHPKNYITGSCNSGEAELERARPKSEPKSLFGTSSRDQHDITQIPTQNDTAHTHHRHNAIYSLDHVF
ncbi:uncharacterized protein RJT20DRAFT_130268 [Scheffersomyces xylosifermentans]|uniref:uncharacterized protein n=1 Tax=Scheffersomyces xylosifermentans TaxID=1304137 RepID=UPI00315DEC8E